MSEEMRYIFAPITKRNDDTREIEGPISGADNIDLDEQVVDLEWLRRAAGPYMKWGNIREQHIPTRAVGKAQALDLDTSDGVPSIRAKIVDNAAWEKVREGVYSGFSVGIKNARIVKDAHAKNGRIIDGDLVEISIVDHPANPSAKFALCKAASGGGWLDMQAGVVIEAAVSADQTKSESQAPPVGSVASDKATMETSTTTTAPDEAKGAAEAAATDVEKAAVHSHHYLDDDGFVQNGAHTHQKGGAAGSFGEQVPYADHKHCKTCANDDRMCGHGKMARKGVEAEEVKAEGDFLAAESGTPSCDPTPSSLTMSRSVEELMHDAKSALEALSLSMDKIHTGKTEHNAEFDNRVTAPAQSWSGGSLFDVKAAVTTILKELLPDLVQQELSKSFGSADLLTKGANPDTVKAAVYSIAESAAAAAVEPVVKRLETVEQLAAPVQGASNAKDVEKAFAGNRGTPAMTFDQATELVRGMPEADRMKAAVEIIGQSQRQPMSLFRP